MPRPKYDPNRDLVVAFWTMLILVVAAVAGFYYLLVYGR